jgi:hypothetical protein
MMKSFLRGLAATVLIVDALAVVVGLLALFGGAPSTGGSILAAAIGGALFAGVLWVLTEVCKKLEDISQVLDEDICEALEAVRDSAVNPDFGRATPVAPSKNP